MECNLARQLLAFTRPGAGELEPAEAAELERHLASCPTCAAVAETDRAFDAAISGAIRAVTVPEGARTRLHTHLLTARRTWWRRTTLRTVTGLVALVLVVSVGLRLSRPTLDANVVITSAYELTGQGRGGDEARDIATGWLRQFDSSLQAPGEFDYKQFAFPQRSDFQGLHSVPTLVFVRGGATMCLHVVREGAFKNLNLLTEQPVESGGCTIAARRYADMPGWVFIVVTAGAPPEVFRRPERTGEPA